MKIAQLNKILVFMILIVVLATTVNAIGVSPARTKVDFTSGLTKEISLSIVNNDQKDMQVVVFAQGDLAEYVDLNYSLVSLRANEGEKQIKFNLNLPDKQLKPGTHTIEIYVMEFVSSDNNGEISVVKATAAVISQINVVVPYPGKYLESNMYVSDANSGEPVTFTLPVYNFGLDKINNVYAEITIYGATYEEIAKIKSNVISLDQNAESKLIASWLPDVNTGTYHAVAEIIYDGKKTRVEKNFNVGNVMVEVKEINVNDFNLGEIAKFDITVENKWNKDLKDIYGEFSVYDKDAELTKYKTASIDLKQREQGILSAYWNTDGIAPGVYNIKVILNFANKQVESIFETAVSFNSIDVNTGSLNAKAIASEPIFSRESIIMVLVFILIAINIGWFIFFRKRMKPSKQNNETIEINQTEENIPEVKN